ncbi:response regulator transcription factor [Acidihalobacter ferrooxydans]|uniref:DNA-binding response regulator n=1 Tax=Acidihalobacter ferrooxydans TaxID=1765967 RepID=A0A1P8UKM8_9GAMM|nr:response regulator transcription factor [Acidihalobacter ferrooxydans]APZ44332.1 DNA-binding response regulator [Acidihalobacter ferrooxydans]
MPPDPEAGTVLLVDDAPDNLRVIYTILHENGYTVRVAPDGFAALRSVRRQRPDVILLDALMPGMDGFETCRQLKEDIDTRDIPVIFLTGLNDSESIVHGFQLGGVDYVTKPVLAEELLARVAAHMQTARLLADTRGAIDSTGHAMAAFDEHYAIHWATPQAHRLLQPLMDANDRLPLPLRQWLQSASDRPYALWHDGERLQFSQIEPGLLQIQRHTALPEPEALARALQLTEREAQVLYWVILGKTNREAGEILAISPRTVNKHLEHVFEKLGVETRTAAASKALGALRG